MVVINILLQISNLIGINPKIFFCVWKPTIYLFQHPVHLIIFLIFLIFILLRKKVWLKIKKFSKKKRYVTSLLLIGYIILLAIFIYKYEPYNNLKLKEDELNILVFPIFNLDKGSYLSIDNNSVYFQETFFDALKANKPQLPEIVGDIITPTPIIVPVEYIPFFIYRPNTFNKFIDKIDGYTFAIWGVKSGDKFEQVVIRLNPKEQIHPEVDDITFKKASDIVCQIFNELENVPYRTKINFFSLLVSGMIEQSLNEMLINYFDSNGCDMARKQLDSCIKKIDESFSNIVKMVPQNQHKIVRYYYNQYIEDYKIFKRRFDLPDSCPGYKKFYKSLLQNLYAPFKDECSYALWLSKQPYAYAVFRYIPMTHWRTYDSNFERFIGYLLNTPHLKMTTEHVKELFDNLRKKYGNKFIINYYEVIILTNMWTDRDYIEKLLEEQRKLNNCKKDLTERQIELFNIIKEEDRFWTD